jgi:hypothetical protein
MIGPSVAGIGHIADCALGQRTSPSGVTISPWIRSIKAFVEPENQLSHLLVNSYGAEESGRPFVFWADYAALD